MALCFAGGNVKLLMLTSLWGRAVQLIACNSHVLLVSKASFLKAISHGLSVKYGSVH